jgi:hypothetical protein
LAFCSVGEVVRVHGEEGTQAAGREGVDGSKNVLSIEIDDEIHVSGETGEALDDDGEAADDDEADVLHPAMRGALRTSGGG